MAQDPPCSPLDEEDRRRLVATARRYSRDEQEAEDLVQAALLVAIERGRPLSDRGWLAGVMRNLGAMRVRTEVRRRRREQAFVELGRLEPPDPLSVPDPDGLSPALARVAQLVGRGCTRDEVRWLLGIRDTTPRQRLSALRRVARPAAPPAAAPRPPGPARRDLVDHPALRQAVVGSADPDGHLFVVSPLTNRDPAATGERHPTWRTSCSAHTASDPCSSSPPTSIAPRPSTETPSGSRLSACPPTKAPTG
jgi:DNA-directed RNA polymerase specialized sigma24 family protein